jgi:hypothetical protein
MFGFSAFPVRFYNRFFSRQFFFFSEKKWTSGFFDEYSKDCPLFLTGHAIFTLPPNSWNGNSYRSTSFRVIGGNLKIPPLPPNSFPVFPTNLLSPFLVWGFEVNVIEKKKFFEEDILGSGSVISSNFTKENENEDDEEHLNSVPHQLNKVEFSRKSLLQTADNSNNANNSFRLQYSNDVVKWPARGLQILGNFSSNLGVLPNIIELDGNTIEISANDSIAVKFFFFNLNFYFPKVEIFCVLEWSFFGQLFPRRCAHLFNQFTSK